MKNHFKEKYKGWVFGILMVICILFIGMSPVNALDASAVPLPESLNLFELLIQLGVSASIVEWLGLLSFIGYTLTQMRAWLPAHWIEKLPPVVIIFIEWLAGNYNGAKNEQVITKRRL